MVGEIAEQPAAERPHQEGRGEQHCGIELLHHGVAVREEDRREIQRERRIGVEIVPFDEIADRADEDRLQPPLDIGDIEAIASGLECESVMAGLPPWGGPLSYCVGIQAVFPNSTGS